MTEATITLPNPKVATPTDVKEYDTPAQVAAKTFLAAKQIEKQGKDAEADRKQVQPFLAALIGDGGQVTLNGNATYTLGISDRVRTVEAKVLAALRVLHPELNGVIDGLCERPENRTPYQVFTLKRNKQ